MEYCSALLPGCLASHLAKLDAIETKAFKIIEISRGEAGSCGHIADRSVASRSTSPSFMVLHPLLGPPPCCVLPPQDFYRAGMVNQQPPSDETPKIQNYCSAPVIGSSFFSCLWNQYPHSLQYHFSSRSSRQLFITTSG